MNSKLHQDEIHIAEVGTVFVPVSDQQKSLRFYLEKLGFEKVGDWPYNNGNRWIEVAPKESKIRLALVPPSEGESSRSGETLCALSTTDIEADHSALLARGVDVDAAVARTGGSRLGLISKTAIVVDPMPPQFTFRDIDGNRFLVVEVPV